MLLKKNISYRFRNYNQYNTVLIANHLELQNRNNNLANNDAVYIYPFNRHKKYIEQKLSLCGSKENIKFLCIQSLDKASIEDKIKIKKWLTSIVFEE